MTEIMESETLSREIADTNEMGVGVTLFDPKSRLALDRNSGSSNFATRALGRGRRSHLRRTSYLGWPFWYDPAEVGTLAPKDFELPVSSVNPITCAMCMRPFQPRRSDHIYCSPKCGRKGARRGGKTVMNRRSDFIMRVCGRKGCENTLIGRTKRAEYCSDTCKKAAFYRRSHV